MNAIYLNDWAPDAPYGTPGIEGLKSDFNITDADLDGVNILLASYTYENHDGTAVVIFERGGKFFEVYGGHCSCYGLEGQWEPSEVTPADLRANLIRGYQFDGCRDELIKALDAFEHNISR